MSNIQKVTVELRNGRFRLIDAAKADDLNPKALILCAAAQCSGYTVMSILQKKKISPKSFEISVEGTLSTENLQPSSVYDNFKVTYHLECRHIGDQNDVSEAVLESHNKKCGVIAMLRKIAPISHDISIVSTESVNI